MTTAQLIAKAESLGITRGYDYPGFSTLCREDRRVLVAHFAAPVAKPEPAVEGEPETMREYLDRVAPIDDMPHRYAV